MKYDESIKTNKLPHIPEDTSQPYTEQVFL